MKTALVKFNAYNPDTDKGEQIFVIRVFEKSGFEVVEGNPDQHMLDELNTLPAPVLPNLDHRVLPDAGLEWARAVAARYNGSYVYATLEMEQSEE